MAKTTNKNKKSKSNFFYLIRIGTDDMPATPEDLKDMEKEIKALCLGVPFIITHHGVEITPIPLK